MKDEAALPMEVLNNFEYGVKAEFQSSLRSSRRSAGKNSNRIPGKDSHGNPGKLEVHFKNSEKEEEGFIIILTLSTIPYDSGKSYRGIKITSGKVRHIFNNRSGDPVYREPHHTEFIQDLTNGNLIVKLHYKLKPKSEIDTINLPTPREKHEDPEIIHPDKP